MPGGLYLSGRAMSVAVRTETKAQSLPPESGGLNLVVIIEGNITEVHQKLRRYLNFISRLFKSYFGVDFLSKCVGNSGQILDKREQNHTCMGYAERESILWHKFPNSLMKKATKRALKKPKPCFLKPQ